ncbi:trypsin-like peptidase domain-containing protein [Clostridium merdae]|uniref:trypsin-like peptidase domain-containing protein n=1 Tax=Clostridium merdae TaxID=1958780 RepID=UPI000A270DF3|nr:trypsin-like peptidase domain-containing protein [Clostridium merdae]
MDEFDWKRPDEGDADKPEQSQRPDALPEGFSREVFLGDAGDEENDRIPDDVLSTKQEDGQLSEEVPESTSVNVERDEPSNAIEMAQDNKELEQEPTLEEPSQENPPQETPVAPTDAAKGEQAGTKQEETTQQNQYPYGSVYGQPVQEQPSYHPNGSDPNRDRNPEQSPYGDARNGWTPPAGYPPYPPPYGYPPYPPQGGQVPFGYQPPRVYAPFGGGMGYPPEYTPKPPRSKGYRLFIGMLIALGAIFVFGFFSISLFTAYSPQTEESTGSSQAPQEPSQAPPESETSPQISDTAEPPPTGVLTDSRFAGIKVLPIPASDESTAKAIYKAVSPSIIGVVCEMPEGTSSGSGIICREDGYIITNSHVIKDTKQHQKLRVILHDNTQYNAAVVGFDKTTDLAVLKIDAKNLPVASFGNSDKLEVGDWVLAIGNPGGMTFASSLSRGVVSGLNRSVGYSEKANMTYIQTDTAISPGASGGALLNLYGQVVGVNTSKLVAEGYEGMGFSIPIARAKEIVDDLIQNGYVSGRARLGIGANQVSSIQQQLGWPQGVIIAAIDSESAFSGTEAKVGDIITKVDGNQISTMAELYQKLGLHKAGEKMEVSIYRPGKIGKDGKTFDVTVTLLADNGDTQKTINVK